MVQDSIQFRGQTRFEQLRCPYCHGDVLEEEPQEACEACRASHHAECWEAHGGCSSCGVAQDRAAPARSAGPQHTQQQRRRRQVTRLGGTGMLRYDHGHESTVIEWGSNLGDAHTRLAIQTIFIILATLGPLLGLSGGQELAAGLLFAAFIGAVYIGIPMFVYHLLELRKSGRLIINAEGFRRDRLGFTGKYLTNETIAWSDIEELGWRGSETNRNYQVYAYTARGQITLARFRFEEHARQFIGHFQRSRARLASEVDASLIRVQQRRDEAVKDG